MTAATVIVPTVKAGGRLARLLDSLAPGGGGFQTIVVNNGSPDGAAEAVQRRFPAVDIVSLPRNEGFSRPVNIAARRAEGRALVLLNDDCVCEPSFVERVVEGLDPARGVVMTAGVLTEAASSDIVDTAGIELDETLLVFDYLNGEPTSVLAQAPDPIGPCAAAAAYDRDAFLDAGGFDEALFAYWEDVDLALRLVREGGRCALARDARGTHEHSATLRSGSARKNYLTGFGRGYVLRKYGVLKPRRLPRVIVSDGVIVAGQALIDGNVAGLRGRVAGFRAAATAPREPYPARIGPPAPGLLASLARRLRRRARLRRTRR